MPHDCMAVRHPTLDYDRAEVLRLFPGEGNMTEELTSILFPHLVSGCDRLTELIAEIR